MNVALALNNKAIKCMSEGDVFEACNMLTLASRVCMEKTEQHAKLSPKYNTTHRDHIISWMKIPTTEISTTSTTTAFTAPSSQRQSSSDCTPSSISSTSSILRSQQQQQQQQQQERPPRWFESEDPNIYNFAPSIKKTCCQQHSCCSSTSSKSNVCSTNTTCGECRDDSHVCPCSVSPVIWYNNALCCQMLGVQHGAKTQDGNFYLQRSLYLYEKVLNVCNTASTHKMKNSKDQYAQSAGLMNLRMAVLNNLACVHHAMGKTDICVKTMHFLKDVLQFMMKIRRKQQQQSDHYTSHRPNASWRIFHFNLMLMTTPRPAAAA